MDKFIINLNKNMNFALEEIQNEIEFNGFLKEKMSTISKLDREIAELKEKYSSIFKENEELNSNYQARYLTSDYNFFVDNRKFKSPGNEKTQLH